jgi:CRISPR/Cas system-associated exonuclease Cas4 (RecB family)
MKNEGYVTASEIGEYVYCRRAWWLRASGIVKEQTTEMLEGTKKHNELSAKLESYTSYKRAALFLLVAGLLGFIIFIFMIFFLK